MTQQTRNVIANVLLGLGMLTIVVFIATHFVTPMRPSWRRDMIWLGLASIIGSRAVRGRRQRAMQDAG